MLTINHWTSLVLYPWIPKVTALQQSLSLCPLADVLLLVWEVRLTAILDAEAVL